MSTDDDGVVVGGFRRSRSLRRRRRRGDRRPVEEEEEEGRGGGNAKSSSSPSFPAGGRRVIAATTVTTVVVVVLLLAASSSSVSALSVRPTLPSHFSVPPSPPPSVGRRPSFSPQSRASSRFSARGGPPPLFLIAREEGKEDRRTGRTEKGGGEEEEEEEERRKRADAPRSFSESSSSKDSDDGSAKKPKPSPDGNGKNGNDNNGKNGGGGNGVKEYSKSSKLPGSGKEILVGDPQQKVKKEGMSVTAILKELAAIQQRGPQKYCVLGTRHCTYLHQQIIELLAYALVLSGNHVYTSGAGGTHMATIRGALRAERPDLLTVVLPQSLSRQSSEAQSLLKDVEDLIEMPQNDEMTLDVASRACNSYLLSLTDQLVSFAFHESTTVIEATREAKEMDMLVTVLYLD